MTTTRLEAFSDGVIAILITIMVLELRMPEGTSWPALRDVLPDLFIYLLSFAFLGIYWNNHHHLFQAVERVNGAILWANMHLLFWLSLVPFTTAWLGDSHATKVPTAAYGIVLLLAAVAYFLMTIAIRREHGAEHRVTQALGKDIKGKASAVAYLAAVPLAFVEPWIAIGIYIAVALAWLVPDRRMSRALNATG